jgi:hypothetical protein
MPTIRFSPFKSIAPTWVEGLALAHIPRLGWRFVDVTTGMESISCVGETYRTRMEALADLDRYNREIWGG